VGRHAVVAYRTGGRGAGGAESGWSVQTLGLELGLERFCFLCKKKHKLYIKSYEYKFYMKGVELDTIYDFVVNNFYLICFRGSNVRLKSPKFKIQNFEFFKGPQMLI
jgi:hypothetical protein